MDQLLVPRPIPETQTENLLPSMIIRPQSTLPGKVSREEENHRNGWPSFEGAHRRLVSTVTGWPCGERNKVAKLWANCVKGRMANGTMPSISPEVFKTRASAANS